MGDNKRIDYAVSLYDERIDDSQSYSSVINYHCISLFRILCFPCCQIKFPRVKCELAILSKYCTCL